MGCGAFSKVAFPGEEDDEVNESQSSSAFHVEGSQVSSLDGSIYNSSRASSANDSVDELDIDKIIPIQSRQVRLWGLKEKALSVQNLYVFMDLLQINMLEMQKALQTFRGFGPRSEVSAKQIARMSSIPVMAERINPLLSRFIRAIRSPEKCEKENLTYREFVFCRRLFQELASHEEIIQFWYLVMMATTGKDVDLKQEIDKKSLMSFLVDITLSKTESFDSLSTKAPSKLKNKVQLMLNKCNMDQEDYNFHHFQKIVEVSNKTLRLNSILGKVYERLSNAIRKNEASTKTVKSDIIMTYFWNLQRDMKRTAKGFRGSKRSVWVHPFEGEDMFEQGAPGIRDITNLPQSRREEAMQVGWKF
eukprot:748249-Hanusia_phi.AAC.1